MAGSRAPLSAALYAECQHQQTALQHRSNERELVSDTGYSGHHHPLMQMTASWYSSSGSTTCSSTSCCIATCVRVTDRQFVRMIIAEFLTPCATYIVRDYVKQLRQSGRHDLTVNLTPSTELS